MGSKKLNDSNSNSVKEVKELESSDVILGKPLVYSLIF